MNHQQILMNGVAADDWLNMAVVWDGSNTFEVWSHVEGDVYRCVDTFTKNNVTNASEAMWHARAWLANVYDEMDRYYNGEAA